MSEAVDTAYEIGDERTLTTGDELKPGDVFRSRGSAPGQSEIYWKVLEQVEEGKYRCKVVGINIYVSVEG